MKALIAALSGVAQPHRHRCCFFFARGSLTLYCEVRACSWLCSFLACSWLCSFTSCRSALLYPLWVHSSGFFSSGSSICSCHPVGCLELCSLSPASLFASASVSPRERRTHTVFAVWCFGLSRACVLLWRSSWHSMSRSPWHSMALQRRFPTSCSPVHVLTHVFSSARFFTCCAWLRVVWL